MYTYGNGKKKFRFENVEDGDFVKFKFLKEDKHHICYGVVKDTSQDGYLGLGIRKHEIPELTEMDCYIDRRAVLQIYPKDYVKTLTPRLALKHIWKDLTFREVKTVKPIDLLYVEHRYISKTGFETSSRFSNFEEACSIVPVEEHHNICGYYRDFFGFTTTSFLRKNDKYQNREVFFSKKCYSELDWSEDPTGDFLIDERGFNSLPVSEGSIICGIVENGEKGLFFRKWFVCSREFLTLWSMVCDPSHHSLLERKSTGWFNQVDYKVKSFNTLLKDLDASGYSIDFKLSLEEKKKKDLVHNVERTALYFPNRYKKVAQVLFPEGEIKYSAFQKKLKENLLWPLEIS